MFLNIPKYFGLSSGQNIIWFGQDDFTDPSNNAHRYYLDLVNDGYNVMWRNDTIGPLTETEAMNIEANYQMVVVSRDTNSERYSTVDVVNRWHSLTVPVLYMNAFVMRSSNLGFYDSDQLCVPGDFENVSLNATFLGTKSFTGVNIDTRENTTVLEDQTVDLDNCIFEGPKATYGLQINSSSRVTLENSTISGDRGALLTDVMQSDVCNNNFTSQPPSERMPWKR